MIAQRAGAWIIAIRAPRAPLRPLPRRRFTAKFQARAGCRSRCPKLVGGRRCPCSRSASEMAAWSPSTPGRSPGWCAARWRRAARAATTPRPRSPARWSPSWRPAAARSPGSRRCRTWWRARLVRRGLAGAAKAFILYRQRRAELRAAKSQMGVHDELKLTVNAAEVLRKRYLLRDGRGQVVETPEQLFRRVARAVAAGEHTPAEAERAEEAFYGLMAGARLPAQLADADERRARRSASSRPASCCPSRTRSRPSSTR